MKKIKRLGEMLIEEGLLKEEDLEKALEYQKKNGKRLGSVLLELGLVKEKDILKVLSKQFNVPVATKKDLENISEDIIRLIPPDVAARYLIVPVARKGKSLILAMVNPLDQFAIEDAKFISGFDIIPVVSLEDNIREAIKKYYGIEDVMDMLAKVGEEGEIEVIGKGGMDKAGKDDLGIVGVEDEELKVLIESGEILKETPRAEEEEISDILAEVESGPIVKLVNTIISDAVERRASDVHIEPYENDVRVRYRIDGILHEIFRKPKKFAAPMVARIKIMAKMKLEEKRKPQDGRIRVRMGDRMVDLRVATVPTVFGEKVAIRILDRTQIPLRLDALGFEPESLEIFRKAIRNPNGIVLVTGPTGCGKTTTLYAALTELNSIEVNISTVEDPVEFTLMGINQVQVKEEVGMTFASGLRAFLRQDPDIIMVGEIRDFETAEIAIRASLTGHLVLSTVHTNTAAATVTRLINMEIEPFLIASTLLVVSSQRLVRKICESCKVPYQPEKAILYELSPNPEEVFKGVTFYKGSGCKKCHGTGYKGRIGLFEVLPVTKRIRELILEKAPTHIIEKAAIEEGMLTLRESGIRKIKAGVTTPEEIIKETKME
ncbi:MAG: ATPase, T2SS/T4P/T4SS family [candidate division WOR-3 bacterium]